MAQESNRCDACILERRAEITNSPENKKRRADEKRRTRNEDIKVLIVFIAIIFLILYSSK